MMLGYNSILCVINAESSVLEIKPVNGKGTVGQKSI